MSETNLIIFQSRGNKRLFEVNVCMHVMFATHSLRACFLVNLITNYIENVCVRVHNVYNFLYTKILNFDPLFDNFRQLASLFALKSFQKDLCWGMHEMEKKCAPKN